MRSDPIVSEVRRIRDAYAARFNYELDEICLDIKEQERASGRNFVSFPARRLNRETTAANPNESEHRAPEEAVTG